MIHLLFNSDDFGKTHDVNMAVLKAHREGVLGSASLMVTGDAFSEAVEMARSYPSLKVGLHLVLCDGKPLLPPSQIPDLIGSSGLFLDPATVGIRIAFCKKARLQAAAEMEAQFKGFIKTGLFPAHIDGHHHLHMHPFIFSECIRWGEELGFKRIRVAREFGNPLPPRRDCQKFFSKLFRHLIFQGLSIACDRLLFSSSLQRLDGVLGLWENGRMSEDYLLRAISQISSGTWEVYVHVGSEGAEEELPALLSLQLKKMLEQQKIKNL